MFEFAPAGFEQPLPSELLNLARLGGVEANTTQSSTDPSLAGHSDRAVDGLIGTNCNQLAGQTSSSQTAYNLCTATTTQANPWWRVNLGAVLPLTTLMLWGRTDCCVNLLTGFQVYVSNTDSFAAAQAGGACANPYHVLTNPPAVIDLTDPANAGRCASA